MTDPITKDEILKTLKFAREIANLDGKSDILAALHATLTRLFPAMPGRVDITAKTYTVKPHPPRSRNNRNGNHHNKSRRTLLPRLRAKQHGK